MPLIRFLLWRVAGALLLVFAVASGAVMLAQLAPGDYASTTGGDQARVAAERHRLGLDQPRTAQYRHWLGKALTLDLGVSLQTEQPVAPIVWQRALNTAELAATALILATLVGIPCGVLTGSRRGGAIPGLLRAGSLVLLSVPPLITSLVLLTVAAGTGWLPVSGMGGFRHLVVPTLALALPVAAALERLQS